MKRRYTVRTLWAALRGRHNGRNVYVFPAVIRIGRARVATYRVSHTAADAANDILAGLADCGEPASVTVTGPRGGRTVRYQGWDGAIYNAMSSESRAWLRLQGGFSWD